VRHRNHESFDFELRIDSRHYHIGQTDAASDYQPLEVKYVSLKPENERLAEALGGDKTQ